MENSFFLLYLISNFYSFMKQYPNKIKIIIPKFYTSYYHTNLKLLLWCLLMFRLIKALSLKDKVVNPLSDGASDIGDALESGAVDISSAK